MRGDIKDWRRLVAAAERAAKNGEPDRVMVLLAVAAEVRAMLKEQYGGGIPLGDAEVKK